MSGNLIVPIDVEFPFEAPPKNKSRRHRNRQMPKKGLGTDLAQEAQDEAIGFSRFGAQTKCLPQFGFSCASTV
jgi:hypothetical protein